MARFLSHDEDRARELLAAAGVTLLREDSPERDALMLEVLDADSRFDRDVIAVEPPTPGTEHEAFGAWHINSADEFHSVRSGEGVLEYVTAGGVVSVLLGEGDIMVVRRAEHRYLPLTTQEWVIRFNGGPDGQLISTDTGRPGAEWPTAL